MRTKSRGQPQTCGAEVVVREVEQLVVQLKREQLLSRSTVFVPMTSTQLAPALITTFVAWRIYSRVRRSVGRQPLQPRRMVARIVIFSVLTFLIGAAAVFYLPALAGLGGGLLLGVPLALLGLKLTRFKTAAEGRFYTPNTYLGLALSLLLVGRIVYRFTVVFGGAQLGDPTAVGLMQSPVTLVLFGVTAGYYIAYYAGVLRQGRSATA